MGYKDYKEIYIEIAVVAEWSLFLAPSVLTGSLVSGPRYGGWRERPDLSVRACTGGWFAGLSHRRATVGSRPGWGASEEASATGHLVVPLLD